MSYTTFVTRMLLVLAGFVLLATSCTSTTTLANDGDTSEVGDAASSDEVPVVDDDPATATDSTGSTNIEPGAGEATGTVWAGVLPQVFADRVIESCPDATPVDGSDMWPASTDAQVVERTLALVQPNPTTCQGLRLGDPVVDAQSVGALEARGFVNSDPELRFDVFVFASSDEASAASLQEAIVAAVGDASTVDTFRIGSMLVASSHLDAFEDRQSDGRRILRYYNSTLVGFQ